MAKFVSGNLVKLRSGGPAMTVSKVHKGFGDGGTDLLECSWFSGGKLQEGRFEENALEWAEPEEW